MQVATAVKEFLAAKAELTQSITTLQAKQEEIRATRARFDTQHFEAVRYTGLVILYLIDKKIETTIAGSSRERSVRQ